MKKLMIAAAVAAMIGGAYADTDFVYDFTASLKTTVGASTKGTKTTFGIGKDEDGNLWYNDANLIRDEGTTDWSAAGVIQTNAVTGISDVKVIKYSKAGKGYTAYKNANGTLTIDTDATMQKNALSSAPAQTRKDFAAKFIDYDVKSAGKWCVAGSYQIASCYRKAGSQKLKDTWYVASDCCVSSTDAIAFYEDEDMDQGTDNQIGESVIFHRFGSDTLKKATKVEMAAKIAKTGDAYAVWDFGEVNCFTIAGQGTWSDKLFSEKYAGTTYYMPGVSSISGNIVGALESTCENCCEIDTPAMAFYCDSEEGDEDVITCDHTAAYGTFTLKINKKASFQD